MFIYGNDKNNKHLVIGAKYKIQTKKWIVEKYLSYIDKKTKMLYFIENKKNINDSKIGYMFGTRGTMHSTKNIIEKV